MDKHDERDCDLDLVDESAEPTAESSATEAELELARQLTEGALDERDASAEAVARLSPRWEARVQSERDPIAEETAVYRRLAEEVDDRYDDGSS